MLYFWNEAMNDLRRKVMTYGIEYFPTSQNVRLTDEDSLREHINDYQLIEGCYQLGIISKEAWFFLQQCREVRNQYTIAHLSDSQIDALEAQNFIKNCVKYVLTHEPPPPGFNIRDFVERLRGSDITGMADEMVTTIRGQAPQIREALLNRLFSEYTDVNCPATLRANIETIAPAIWETLDQSAAENMGQRYVRARMGPSQDAALHAFNFFRVVRGLGAIPEAYRRPIFESHARDLIKVHFEPNNFYTEGPRARALLQLGFEVPKDAAEIYAKAVTLSFIGNRWGHCWDAAAPNQQMLEYFNIDCVRALLGLLESDRDVVASLTDQKPANRLKELAAILTSKPLLPAHEKRLTFYQDTAISKLQEHFQQVLLRILGLEEIPF